MFVRAIQIVLTIFCMIGIGYLLAHKGWLHAEASSLLSRMVLYVALPAMIVQNLFTQYNRQTLLSGAYGMLAPLSVLTLLYLFSGLLARILPIPQRRRGVFRSVFTFSNSIFIGLPICKAVLGDAAIPSSLFYYIVNTSFFWIIGANGIRRDGEKEAVSLSFLETIRRVFSPPLITFLLSATLVL
ncbi:MAG: AEC family transporter, partial [Clostridia bacterium]